ncbi:MAG: beta-ketoacyl-[acyl-carrier-protein] synthase family protein, partial [Bacteroidetes bacterium]|nr:beta-ketoacyl-[acyl-carrier-protein] synthase family protein [Bacteroidota bacterium]
MNKIYVTGIGIISAIGNNVAETLVSVRKQKSGISELKNIKSRHKALVPVGEVKSTNEELIIMGELPPDSKTSRTALLGVV